MLDQLARYAGDADAAVALRLRHHASVGLLPAVVDHAGDLRHLAARERPQTGTDAADHADREDAIADHQVARLEAFLAQAVHLISGEPGHHWHAGDSLLWWCGSVARRQAVLSDRQPHIRPAGTQILPVRAGYNV